MNERIQSLFPQAVDLKTYAITNSELTIEFAYIASLCDEDTISQFISVPFVKEETSFSEQLRTLPNYNKLGEEAELQEWLLKGYALIEANGQLYALLAVNVLSNDISQTLVESALQGSQIALSEDLNKSLNLIRSMYPSLTLTIEQGSAGTISRTPIMTVFDQKLADPEILKHVRDKITGIQAEMIQASGELEKQLAGKLHHLFPTILITERPDRVAMALSNGKVVILLKGSMFALILPSTFFDFMHAVEDNFEAYWMTRFLIILRYFATFLTITLPALYVAIVSYNPELFRIQLAFSVAASRAAVPYPSFIEVFIMLFMIEMLIEASIRLPRFIGSTATTVGGLILGQAAQEAGLVSSIMIIVTSVVAISNFVIPVNTLSFAIRFLKYPLLAVSIFFGISGIAVMLFFYLVYICNLRSFGIPYFRLPGLTKSVKHDIGQVNGE
ncbi:spore germination protein [Paenibacillus sp. HB172176]|uniref:spore germination protein n=1 Tax=Paenibacillus sp. HB172176 TaxID=2493690 RepID=UPI00143B2E86|nr:spore germination protein [Paenibacillus sp. HB172176]